MLICKSSQHFQLAFSCCTCLMSLDNINNDRLSNAQAQHSTLLWAWAFLTSLRTLAECGAQSLKSAYGS